MSTPKDDVSSSSVDDSGTVIINLEDLSANLNKFLVARDPSGNGHFLPAFHECMDVIKDSLDCDPSTTTSLKRMFAGSGMVLPPQHQDDPEFDPETTSFYGPVYDTTQEPKYHPHHLDGQGRPRDPTPPPPDLPEFEPDEQRVEYPDGKVYWMPLLAATVKLAEITVSRQLALRLGGPWPPIPPPRPRVVPMMVVDTPNGQWLMPPEEGAAYRDELTKWAQATNARRERDGIAERVDGDYDAKVAEEARAQAEERRRKEEKRRQEEQEVRQREEEHKRKEQEELERMEREEIEQEKRDEIERQEWKEALRRTAKKARTTLPTPTTVGARPSSPVRLSSSTPIASTSETHSPRSQETIKAKVEADDDYATDNGGSLKRTHKPDMVLIDGEYPEAATAVPASKEDRIIKPLPARARNSKIEGDSDSRPVNSLKRAREETKEDEDAVLTPSKRARVIKPIPSSRPARTPSPTRPSPSESTPTPSDGHSLEISRHSLAFILIPTVQPPAPTSTAPAASSSSSQSALGSARSSAPAKEPTRRSARIMDRAKKSATPSPLK